MLSSATTTVSDNQPAAAPTVGKRYTRPVHHVLAAVHRSPAECHPVLQIAARLAKAVDVPLTALAVIEPTTLFPTVHGLVGIASDIDSPPSSNVLHGVEEYLTELMSVADRDYAPGGVCHARSDVRVRIGDPDREITRMAAAMDAAILVIGRGDVLGRGKVLHALLNGTHTPRVYQALRLPVVSVAHPKTGRDPLETIVIATDLSAASWDAAVTAVRAAPAGAQVHVLHVLSGDPTVVRHRCETTRAAVAAWSAPLATLLPFRAMLAFSVLTGDPYTAVATHLSTLQATCVAVGEHRSRHPPTVGAGRTLPERLLATWRGSVVIGAHHDGV